MKNQITMSKKNPAGDFRFSPGLSIGFIAAWCALHALNAAAEEQTLAPVIVKAAPAGSETLLPIEAARTRIATIPGGANIVDAEQYKEGRVSTLNDVLQFSPGVFVASRFGAEETRLSIRGSGLQRTFHMRGIQLLQDGVPLNLADGSVDFQAVEPLAARYVEVYRGANALQFGSTTLGGAVNFVSPSGLNHPPFAARIEAGSFGYKRAQVAVAGKNEKLDWFIAGSEFYQDGFRQHSKQDTQRVSGNLGVQLSDAVETRFFLTAVTTDSELPGALTKAEMYATPKMADPATVTGDQHRDFTLYRLSNLTTWRIDGQQRVEIGGFYSNKSLHHPIFQVLEQRSDDYGINARYISDQKLFGNKNQLIAGITLQQGELSDDRFANVNGQAGARTAQSKQRSTNFTVFAENQHYLLPSTALVIGAQAASAKRRLLDAFLANGDNSVNETFNRVSPKIGMRHELTPAVQVYGNISGSYEPPTFGELNGGPNVTPVDAQRARTFELGTRGSARESWGKLNWDVSLYRAQVKKELLALNDVNGNPLGTINADRTIHQGIEAGLEASFGSAWIARASYVLNDFRFDGDRTYGDNRLAGVPRQILQAELLYNLENGFYAGPNVRIASSTYVDHANSLRAAGYGIVGFKVGQKIGKNVSWFADFRNLTDKTYAATTNVIADARGLDSRQFYPGDGRSLYAGIELTY
ncbi:iron complex outermembrane receptor protein [Paucimonas lemoignei]|uniref:Iron complex outermembrane receptor protein n=1 Tax=Paucimonas lemoignei TaxID=29443 RepID=A0A4R3HVC4_PAULE|nr:TonB-dependent receptor [Paucimonas lemoignei]TCS36015.1 iron complex outermembrane receptor protein [Paucimonas lemoignei]